MTATLFYRGPSIQVLHEDYAKRHRVDPRAALRERREIEVNAPVARVWKVLSDVTSWDKTLEPGVHDIHVEQGVVVDAPFTRVNKGSRMNARFAVVDKERELAWTGTAIGGAKAVHRYFLDPVSDGVTRVTVEESMAGPVLALAFFTTAKMAALMETCLVTLKAACEGTPR
jgi:carbon monoxide dehydrogenase subunit G